MPPTDDNKNPGAQEPNWVDKWTLYVLAATLVVIAVYTCETHQTNDLTRKALELNARPYISADIITCHPPLAGQKLECMAGMENTGKVPANAYVRAIAVYSLDKFTTVPLPVTETHHLVWIGKTVGEIVGTAEPITEGQLKDILAGRGYLYLHILIRYGLYHTEICTKLSTIRHEAGDTDKPFFSVNFFSYCDDPNSNDAD